MGLDFGYNWPEKKNHSTYYFNFSQFTLTDTQVSSLKYPGILLFFFVGGGEIVREGGYY